MADFPSQIIYARCEYANGKMKLALTDPWYSRVKQIATWLRKLNDLPLTITTTGTAVSVFDHLTAEIFISSLGVSFALHEIALWLAEGVITLVKDVRITPPPAKVTAKPITATVSTTSQ